MSARWWNFQRFGDPSRLHRIDDADAIVLRWGYRKGEALHMVAKTHPKLLEQMDRERARPIQAIIQLQSGDHDGTLMSPEKTAKLADNILSRVAAEVGRPVVRCNVLRNLATMVVEADPEFLQALIRQPEVVSATPNQTSESPMIEPKGKRPASASS